MDLAQLRDLSIVVFTVLGIIAALVVIVTAMIVFTKLMSILNTVQATARNISGTSRLVSEMVAKPTIKVASFAIGVQRAVSIISGLRKRKEKGKND